MSLCRFIAGVLGPGHGQPVQPPGDREKCETALLPILHAWSRCLEGMLAPFFSPNAGGSARGGLGRSSLFLISSRISANFSSLRGNCRFLRSGNASIKACCCLSILLPNQNTPQIHPYWYSLRRVTLVNKVHTPTTSPLNFLQKSTGDRKGSYLVGKRIQNGRSRLVLVKRELLPEW